MQDNRRLVVVTADESVLPDLRQHLGRNFQTTLLTSYAEILESLSQVSPDVILLDLDQGSSMREGMDVLRELRELNHDVVLAALTRSASASVRAKAADAGADEVFTAPVDIVFMQVTLRRALDVRTVEIENRRLRENAYGRSSFHELIGASEPMRRLYDAVSRVAPTDTTVLIRGESGTGKELVARAIVALSLRCDKPFISLNCAALPESLMEAELFGYDKGAFTGAVANRAGHIEQAHGGTLFLDEISTLPISLQTKLLRVLQDRSLQRLGGKPARKVDFRLLTASNDNLEEMVRTGRFREDLYYRIHVVPIFVPPLRERVSDIPLLVDHFMRLCCAANRQPLRRFSPEVFSILEQYQWPGNVRELENLVQRLVLMGEGPVITPEHLPQQVVSTVAASQEAMLIPDEGIDFDHEMERIQMGYLQAALSRAHGSKTAAARLLRMDLQRIKYLCRKYHIGG